MEEYIIKQTPNEKITVSDVHKVLLDIAKYIKEICYKNNINYWLIGGSALGAYRHQGFIPWDDDFDIAMMYEDYLKFLSMVDILDNEKYAFHCFERNKKYNVLVPAMKIRKRGTYIEEINTLLKNRVDDCDGIFIDIFVYDYVSNSKVKDLSYRMINQILMPFIILFENIKINPIFFKKIFIAIARKYGRKNKGSDLIGIDLTWTFRSIFKPYVYKFDEIFPLRKMKFEDTEFYCPNKIESFLEKEIGPGYKEYPPENKRYARHIKDIRL